MECDSSRSHCAQPAGAVCRVRSSGDEMQSVGCEARSARECPARAQQRSVRLREYRRHGVRSGGGILAVGAPGWNLETC